MKTREEALSYGLSFPDTYQEAPFHDDNWQLIRVKGSKKAFLWVYEKDGIIQLNVKANPEWRDYWRDAFASVIPGYHQNKEHWNTILLDGIVPDDAVRTMIAESYDIITDSPTKRIYEAVKQIPRGKVATYGQIAALAGEPKMARAVGNALHKNTDPEHIPCYRVVNSKGELAAEFVFGGAGKQADMLAAKLPRKRISADHGDPLKAAPPATAKAQRQHCFLPLCVRLRGSPNCPNPCAWRQRQAVRRQHSARILLHGY